MELLTHDRPLHNEVGIAMADQPVAVPVQLTYDAYCQDCRWLAEAGAWLYYLAGRFLCRGCANDIEIAEGGL